MLNYLSLQISLRIYPISPQDYVPHENVSLESISKEDCPHLVGITDNPLKDWKSLPALGKAITPSPS